MTASIVVARLNSHFTSSSSILLSLTPPAGGCAIAAFARRYACLRSASCSRVNPQPTSSTLSSYKKSSHWSRRTSMARFARRCGASRRLSRASGSRSTFAMSAAVCRARATCVAHICCAFCLRRRTSASRWCSKPFGYVRSAPVLERHVGSPILTICGVKNPNIGDWRQYAAASATEPNAPIDRSSSAPSANSVSRASHARGSCKRTSPQSSSAGGEVAVRRPAIATDTEVARRAAHSPLSLPPTQTRAASRCASACRCGPEAARTAGEATSSAASLPATQRACARAAACYQKTRLWAWPSSRRWEKTWRSREQGTARLQRQARMRGRPTPQHLQSTSCSETATKRRRGRGEARLENVRMHGSAHRSTKTRTCVHALHTTRTEQQGNCART